MPVSIIWRCVFICVVAWSVAGVQAQRVRSDQDTLRQLEHDWHNAVLENNVDFVASLLADEFVATYDDGNRGDKQKELALVAGFNQQIDAWSMDEFKIQIHRDTAVVHFTLRLIGPMQGVPTELTFRYIDVWVFRDGRWQCVASQSTRVRPEEPLKAPKP